MASHLTLSICGTVCSVAGLMLTYNSPPHLPWFVGSIFLGSFSLGHTVARLFCPDFDLCSEDPFEDVTWEHVKRLPGSAKKLNLVVWLHLCLTCLGSVVMSYVCPMTVVSLLSVTPLGTPGVLVGFIPVVLGWFGLQRKGQAPTMITNQSVPTISPPTTLHILSHNMNCIYFGGQRLRSKKRIRLQNLLEALKKHNSRSDRPFDIIMIQELFVFRLIGLSFGTSLRDWFINEAQSLGYSYSVVCGRSGRKV
jgi:hypothetical protein